LSEKVFGNPETEEGFRKMMGALGRMVPIIAGGILFAIGSSLHEGGGEVRGKIKGK
jgi:hypothetical protein